MAFVRRRGSQLVLVQAERPEAKGSRPEQKILFTIFSKAEAVAITSSTGDHPIAPEFSRLLEGRYPRVKFDWSKIRDGIDVNIEVLPDLYEYKELRLGGDFREGMTQFARQLLLADAHHLAPAGEVLRENRAKLRFLKEMIDWRLRVLDNADKLTAETGSRKAHDGDDEFLWKYSLRGSDVPMDAEEYATGLYERRELGQAKAAFQTLVECFPEYADGYNYLQVVRKSLRPGDDVGAKPPLGALAWSRPRSSAISSSRGGCRRVQRASSPAD